jgi:transcriptional regulator GlxA family with amidase domain
MRPRRIGILGYEGVTAINLVGPVECFTSAARVDDKARELPAYEVVLVAAGERHFATDSGLKFTADVALADAREIDTFIIAGGSALRSGNLADEIASSLRARAGEFRRIVSICSGIYAVAPTGLLDGRTVTTHWRFAGDVSQRFPALRMNARELFVKDGKFYTSGGATAGIDLAIALIQEDFGDEVALSVARTMLAYRRRDGDQEQYADPPRVNGIETEKIGELAHWVERNLDSRLSLDDLARRSGLTSAKINERFKEGLGTTPAAFVKRLRLDECRRRLARGESVEEVAKFVRFGSKYYFEREFRWQFGIGPEEYRFRFAAAEP